MDTCLEKGAYIATATPSSTMLCCGTTKYRKGPQKTHKGALRAKLQEIGTN